MSNQGRRQSSAAFVMLVGATREDAHARLGVTVGRKVGNAVVRNRVKRRIREWFRREGQELLSGRDLVVIARGQSANLTGNGVFAELSRVAQGVR